MTGYSINSALIKVKNNFDFFADNSTKGVFKMTDLRHPKIYKTPILIKETSCFGSVLEKEGPLGKYLDGCVSDKLGKAIAKYSEDNAKAISKGLFRYAVQLEMMCRVLAATNDIDKDWLEGMRHEAINNVRRTRGKVRFEEILDGYYDD